MPRESAMAIDGEDDDESDSEDELGKITDSGRSSLNGSGANGAHATTEDVDMGMWCSEPVREILRV